MAFYNVCPYCGANLDPGERCDCREQPEEHEKPIEVKEVKPA